ncbi:helix-turn-helix transcriptional regulator [Kiloniella majae]|uniref:helix-turn-helix transcriptional regulator n=1 Tax=Kiloniella majae TaxID=1938558 RepID=UPI000A2775B5|nr:helix-turn-helix transcriptional regulator [Kiloniella majae]
MQKQLNAVALAYEAALEPKKWPEALSAIATACNANGAVFALIEPNTPELYNYNKFSDSYPEEEYWKYITAHGKFESDLCTVCVEQLKNQPEYSTLTDREMLALSNGIDSTNAFRDAEINLNVFMRMGILINQKAPWVDVLGLQFSRNYHNQVPIARDTVSELVPYLKRATSLIRPVHLLKSQYGMLLDVLDKLAIGIGIVSNNGTLILKNTAFDQILDLDSLYLDPHNRLRAKDQKTDSILLQSISDTSKMSIGADFAGGTFLNISKNDNPCPVSLEISPLGRKGKDSPLNGWSIIFAVDPEWRLVTNAQKLAKSYSLTSTEKEICQLLLEGNTNRDIASIRNCGLETIKSHVSNLLAKTWTRNRTELARLAAAAELPLVN